MRDLAAPRARAARISSRRCVPRVKGTPLVSACFLQAMAHYIAASLAPAAVAGASQSQALSSSTTPPRMRVQQALPRTTAATLATAVEASPSGALLLQMQDIIQSVVGNLVDPDQPLMQACAFRFGCFCRDEAQSVPRTLLITHACCEDTSACACAVGLIAQAGLDSLGAVELRSVIGARFNLQLPATLAFDYPTATALAGFVASSISAIGASTPCDTSTQARACAATGGARAAHACGHRCKRPPGAACAAFITLPACTKRVCA